MRNHRSRTIRTLVLLSLIWGNGNGGLVPSLFAVSAAPPLVKTRNNDVATTKLQPPETNGAGRARIAESYGKLPMSFEANQGQFDSQVKFASRGRGYALFLTANEAVMVLSGSAPNNKSVADNRERVGEPSEPSIEAGRTPLLGQLPSESVRAYDARRKPARHSVLRMKIVGGKQSPRAEQIDEVPGKCNYFIGNDPSKWRTNVTSYAKVRYSSVYRGIDLVYYGDQGSLEYDFNVSPGGNPGAIRIRFEGAECTRIDANGDLLLKTSGGEVRQHKPVVYQAVNGKRETVTARYVVKGRNQFGFEVGRYDSRKPLVIDPVLSYATYLGGISTDAGFDIAVDSNNRAYIVGTTSSNNFPTVAPLQPVLTGSPNAFVTCIDVADTKPVYSTYLGGSGFEQVGGVAADSQGNAYIIGHTTSANFPTANALQSSLNGPGDAFVVKLSPDGQVLVYSTYLGGSGGEWGLGITVDEAGSSYLCGATFSTDFPTVGPIQSTSSGGLLGDAYIAKLNPSGSALVYSTYVGGFGEEACQSIAVDPAGNAYVTGYTRSPNFPTANPLQSTFGGPAFRTTDGGGVWSQINNGLNSSEARALAVAQSSPATVYAAGSRGTGIFKTTDSGNSWTATNNGLDTTAQFDALAVDPVDPSVVYAGNFSVSKSTNGGASWFSSGAGIGVVGIVCLAIDPTTPSTLYAGAGQFSARHAFKSTNGGASWVQLNNGFSSGGISSLAVDPTNSNTLYAGSSSRAYKSTDAGASWNVISFANSSVAPLVIDPTNSAVVYLGASSGVLKSTNGGSTFGASGPGLTGFGSIDSLVIDPINPFNLYAVRGFSGNAFKSTNAGGSWSEISNGLTIPFINDLAINPVDPSILYVGTTCLTDAFVIKLNPSGSAMTYSTYLGGSRDDTGNSIAVDSSGNAYVTGQAFGSDFPTVNALQPIFGGSTDAFITKVDPTGSALLFSTFLGGSDTDVGERILLDAAGNIYLAGFTKSPNFPTVDPFQPNLGGLEDAVVLKLNAAGSALTYSTYLGGTGSDRANGIAVDSEGTVYTAGQSFSTNFPTTAGAFQTVYGGGSNDAFFARIVSSPSAVKLSSFEAVGFDEGVLLKWQTGFEAQNLGFNIYREAAGKRSLVNPELVAGSALRAGASTRIHAGQSYAWWDKGIADCQLPIADCRAAQYWLEEIDLNGTRSMHGPFSVQRVGGGPPRETRADLLSSLGTGEPRTRQIPLPYRETREVSSGAQFSAFSLASEKPKHGAGPAVKLTVNEEGWYRVTQQELVAAGFDSKTDPRRLQLHLEGTDQAILVRGEQDGGFDAGDAIEFFATGQDNAFSDAHVYWLVSSDRPGRRISTLKSKGKAGGSRSFAYTVERRDRTIYFSSLKNGDAENFFGGVVASQPVDQTVTIQHLDTKSTAAAEVEIALQGVTDLRGAAPDHQVSVRLNGTEIGKVIFDGQANIVQKFAVKSSLLFEGDNVISLESELQSNDVSLVDYVRVTYAHTYTCDQDSLRMAVAAGTNQTIAGFTSPSIRVVDISNPASVTELNGAVQRQADGYSVTVNLQGQDARTLLALTEDRVKRPAAIKLDQRSNWRDANNQANLLIVTRREFFPFLEPLKALREGRGLRVALVDIEDIFDEFSNGEKTPQAVRDFIEYAATNWKEKPAFVLLAGDASLDPRDYLGFGDNDLVPTKLVDTSLMETAFDDWFADFKNDGLPEISIGRLPFRSPEEAETMVSKIISYEASRPATEALLVADRNGEFDFETASAQVQELMPSGLTVNRLNRAGLDPAKAKLQLIQAIVRGQKIVNYIGHGSSNQWNGSLLTNDDARTLTNGDRLPLFVMMTCLNGYFHDAAADSLAEALLKSERGGAVAVWASSGVTSPNSQAVIDRELCRLLFGNSQSLTLGEAITRAKAAASDPDIRRTWVLLGDPSMRLK